MQFYKYDPSKQIVVNRIDPETGESRLIIVDRPPYTPPAPLIVQKVDDKSRQVSVNDPTLAEFYEPKANGND